MGFPNEIVVIEQDPPAGTRPFIACTNVGDFDSDELKDAIDGKCARYVLTGTGDIVLGPTIAFPPAKKRGRPAKTGAPVIDSAPKKRGRPPKGPTV